MRFDPAEVDAADDFRLRLIAARYLLVRSDHAVERGDGAAAAAARDAARRVAGDRAEVLGALALRAAAEGDTAQAITDYEAALARREDAVLVNRLGRLRHASGDLAGAERAFRRAIAIEPELAVAHSNLGALLGSQGEMAEAARVLETAVALDPLSVMALNNLAMARLGLRDREAAAVALRRSLALDPAQPRVRALLAKIER
jgi:Flp pilus assembly protein TadD